MEVLVVATLTSRQQGTEGSSRAENSSSRDPQTHSNLAGQREAVINLGAPGEEGAKVVPENSVGVRKSLPARAAAGEEVGLGSRGGRTVAVGNQQEPEQVAEKTAWLRFLSLVRPRRAALVINPRGSSMKL